jgi:hypothetical protein
MVDLAIAANFVRELTEDQFAQQQQGRRRTAAANRIAAANRTAAANRPTAGSDPAPRASRPVERRRMARTLARLVQVRG